MLQQAGDLHRDNRTKPDQMFLMSGFVSGGLLLIAVLARQWVFIPFWLPVVVSFALSLLILRSCRREIHGAWGWMSMTLATVFGWFSGTAVGFLVFVVFSILVAIFS